MLRLLALLLPLAAVGQVTVDVDPPDGVAGGTVLPLVGGVATVPAGVDLDLGFRDHLLVELTQPVGEARAVTVEFATSTRPEFAADLAFAVPAEMIIADGRAHRYRLDVGLVVHWRDELRGLRLTAPGARFGRVELGDLPGDEYRVNEDLNLFVGDAEHPAETLDQTERLESKHFLFWWSPMSRVTFDRFEPLVMARRALRMSEECYQVYCKVAGFALPFENTEPERRDGRRYKINITSWYQGTWMGGHRGWTYYNIPGWGLADEGWGNPVPHEFGHALQGAQPGFLTGAHWESHANYLTELRNQHFAPLLPGHLTRLERGVLERSCFVQDQFRLIYADFRLHAALDGAGAELGLPAWFATRLWTDGPHEMTAWAKLASLLPAGLAIEDVAGRLLRRWPLLDLPAGAAYRLRHQRTPRDRAAWDQATGSALVPLPGAPGRYRVPWGRAPLRYAFMWHELTPEAAGRPFEVTVSGIDVPGDGESWRWSIAAERGDGSVRYSDCVPPGTLVFGPEAGEERYYLIVVATPAMADLSPHGTQDEAPFDRDPRFRRYPYDVALRGAAPSSAGSPWPRGDGAPHANGGGWVAAGATVEPTAYVGREAVVLDGAKVLGSARVDGRAVVADQATVADQAQVTGRAFVGGESAVAGRARIRDQARIVGRSRVDGDARVQDHATVTSCQVGEVAVVRGNAAPWDSTITGHAIADWDYSGAFELRDGTHFCHVPWGGWFGPYWEDTLRTPRGLLASYRFDEPDGQVVWDEFGALAALTHGAAERVADAEHGRCLRLAADGRLELDAAVVDSREWSIGLWLRPETSDAAELVHLGAAGSARVVLAWGPEPEWRILAADGSTARLSLGRPPADRWLHLTLTLDGQVARAYLDGRPAATTACALVGEALMPAAPEVAFDGRVGGLAALVDDVRTYAVALQPDEVAREMDRGGANLAVCLPRARRFGGADAEFTGARSDRVRSLTATIVAEADQTGYQPVFDARDERHPERHGLGFGTIDGRLYLRVDGLGDQPTEVTLKPGEPHAVTLTADGRRAALYLDGKLVAERDYTAADDRISRKILRLGFSQQTEDPASRAFFRGTIEDAVVSDRAMSAADVAAEHGRRLAGG